MLKIVECPRDAMQGMKNFIPTESKIQYINQLLKVGFDTIDFGSFVSPRAVPQMADTKDVLVGLELEDTQTRLLAIVANLRGVQDALQFEEIEFLGYPFSISETFQLRNTRKSIADSLDLVKETQELCIAHGRELVIYISMGFGNPYGDPWSPEIAEKWVEKMAALEIKTIALADTIGAADPQVISSLFNNLVPQFPDIEFGAHFHSLPQTRTEKIQAAWEAGCRRFDSAMLGYGGCPFAKDELTGNIATETLVEFAREKDIETGLQNDAFIAASQSALSIFG